MTSSTSGRKTRDWLFNTMATILGLLIWYDVSELRQDVKKLLSETTTNVTEISNLKQRVDRLEQKVDRISAFTPEESEKPTRRQPVKNDFPADIPAAMYAVYRHNEQSVKQKLIPNRYGPID